ncbi:MAG TPA: orotidine-5'-phosphate decarboxylase [Campylobacterales bacterium]|nr:orotidine-5'-phosphate decarboxylase [Campylobacterales bacterium]
MKLCVALDLPTHDENIALAKELKSFDIWVKVGFRSYIRDGKKILEELKTINPNFKIFLDLKLYDIPNTMADAAEEITKLGVDMFNIHASSGTVAMQTVMERLKTVKNPPIVLAVTALTSFDNEAFKEIYHDNIDTKALQFAKDAHAAGINGVVCSAHESWRIKANTNNEFLTLTPGIRPFGEDAGDQKRVADINMAKEESVDFIVIGRPIYKADNPKEVVQRILSNS